MALIYNDKTGEFYDPDIPNKHIVCGIECPECGSTDIEDDGSNYLQYTCNECGHIWGHDNTIECPVCGSHDIEDDGTVSLPYKCNCCGYIFDDDELNIDSTDDDEEEDDEIESGDLECPECGSTDIEDDGSNYLQYTCNECGHIWGHDNTIECPVCGSHDIENDGTVSLPYKCNCCGYIFDDEAIS